MTCYKSYWMKNVLPLYQNNPKLDLNFYTGIYKKIKKKNALVKIQIDVDVKRNEEWEIKLKKENSQLN